MGAGNAVSVYVRYGHKLDGGAMRLLTWMALVSLDPPGNPMFDYPPCLYWQGWEAQAEALGYRDIPTDGGKRDAVSRSVRRIRMRLVEAGAIELVRRGSGGYRSSTWRVLIE